MFTVMLTFEERYRPGKCGAKFWCLFGVSLVISDVDKNIHVERVVVYCSV